MGDIMRGISFGGLMNRIFKERERHGTIFGIGKTVKYRGGNAMPIFNEKIEAPFGPAAGPNTQLAQNIIASYVTGSRFFELKTVQVMDGEELSKCVAKPCITAADECYNCEWSTELTVPQAFDEYVKAWFACKLLAKEFSFGDPDAFVFNMSVGYDLEGIKSEKIDKYIEDMKDASATAVWEECHKWTLANLDKFKNVDEAFVNTISPEISSSITESTLHGCPPDEIERIATYLLIEKGLNTYIKCNPTLLGYDFARKRLDSLGFDYVAFDDHHFKEDLQWEDAVPMFKRLMELAKEKGLEFGLKLTNTFPVDVAAGELPSEEMYMAGRSLFPLTIALARKVSEEFGGALRISYSGGADIDNIEELYGAGISPITMATNVLKPGGYERFTQIGERFNEVELSGFKGVDVEKLKEIEASVEKTAKYRKPIKPLPSKKIGEKLTLFDCFTVPCLMGCPIHQDIPEYLDAMERGDAETALRIILERNALPFTTGTICPHTCTSKCMRGYYESPLSIRQVKLEAAKKGYEAVLSSLRESGADTSEKAGASKAKSEAKNKKVAIIGGGPAGLSAAAFLGRAGIPVTIFEQRRRLGGVVRYVIPDFRIEEEAIEKDIELCLSYGAEVRTATRVESLSALRDEGFTDFIIATGAWEKGQEVLQYGVSMDALEFLSEIKRHGANMRPGRNVVVIGGGNTAMDAARAAKRLTDVEKVRLVYRRTRRYMPADEEELEAALADGVEFMELLSPIGAGIGSIKCEVMKLGSPDESGRRSSVPTGETVEIPADMVITAVGEQIDTKLYEELGIAMERGGRPIVDEGMQTGVNGIYAIGDCRRGPATVVKAIADALAAAEAISGVSFDGYELEIVPPDKEKLRERHGRIINEFEPSADNRCLGCPSICEACVEVCPNRANVAINLNDHDKPQILHIDGMCNECGNCAVFCPYDGKPYRDKLTLFWSREDFDNSENTGFLLLDNGECLLRRRGNTKVIKLDDTSIPAAVREMISATLTDYDYLR